MPAGRPTIFTQELADKICIELATGKSMRSVCKQEGMPVMDTMWRWLREKKDFSEQYARAKQESADAMAEEVIDISDETIDMISQGDEKKSTAYAQAQRLRVDTRKWLMAKMKPKKYGDSMDLTSKGEVIKGVPIYGGKAKV